jgi:nucleoid-associated protein YgaU
MARTRVRWGRVGGVLAAGGLAVTLVGGAAHAGSPAHAGTPAVQVGPAAARHHAAGGYVVRQGDTLWAIAVRLAGPGGDPRPIVDALVAANHLGPALAGGASAGEIDAAAARVAAERAPEVAEIQRLQQGPPRLLFGPAWRRRLVLGVLPLLVRTGLVARAAGSVFRRFAYGVTTVRLAA